MEALHDVVKAGYVRYIGMSSCYAWQCKAPYDIECTVSELSTLRLVHKMQNYAITKGLTPFIAMQVRHRFNVFLMIAHRSCRTNTMLFIARKNVRWSLSCRTWAWA